MVLHITLLVINRLRLFNLHAGGSGFRLYDSPNIKLTIWFHGAGHLSVSWPIGVPLVVFFCSSVSVVLMTPKESPGFSSRCNCRVLILASSQPFSLVLVLPVTTHL